MFTNLSGHISHKDSTRLHQSGDVYLHNEEAWCAVYEPVSVCQCVWSKETLGSRDSSRGKSGGAGKILSGSGFCGYDDNQTYTHTNTYTHWIDMQKHLFLSEPLLSLSCSLPLAHTESQTHAPKPENCSLACKHWADGLPNDCCVQCKGSVLHSHYTSTLQPNRPQSKGLDFIYSTS